MKFKASKVTKLGHVINVLLQFEELLFEIAETNFIIINLFNSNNEIHSTKFKFVSRAQAINWIKNHNNLVE